MRVGFIGLGNVGGKLAGSLARNGVDLAVFDLDSDAAAPLVEKGATAAGSPGDLAGRDVVITCLPSPAASRAVVEAMLPDWRDGTVWLEMSTTSADEVVSLAQRIEARGGSAMDAPVSGGCHRAATGNIAILASGKRETFERVLPLLTILGRDVLHAGPLGTASRLKVVTNYLATANLVAVCEALAACRAADLDLATAYEAIRISSGNSFVHETEGQVILNGSRDISFTMGLVKKDVGLFNALARDAGLDLELGPMLERIFDDGIAAYGFDEWSPNIIRRLEDRHGIDVRAPGFPAQIEDDEPEVRGREIAPPGRPS